MLPVNDRPPRARAALFAALLAVIVLGPAYPQLMGGSGRWLRPWTMLSTLGLDATAVEYWRVSRDGNRSWLDRYDTIAHAGRDAAPRYLREVRTAREAVFVGERLCELLGGADEVHVRFRRATPEGWKTQLDRGVCRTVPFPEAAR